MREEFEILISIFFRNIALALSLFSFYLPEPDYLISLSRIPLPKFSRIQNEKFRFKVDGNNHFKCSLGIGSRLLLLACLFCVVCGYFFVSASRRQIAAATVLII